MGSGAKPQGLVCGFGTSLNPQGEEEAPGRDADRRRGCSGAGDPLGEQEGVRIIKEERLGRAPGRPGQRVNVNTNRKRRPLRAAFFVEFIVFVELAPLSLPA